MNKIAEKQIINYIAEREIEERNILSSSFNIVCEKITLKNNVAFVAKYYQNKKMNLIQLLVKQIRYLICPI